VYSQLYGGIGRRDVGRRVAVQGWPRQKHETLSEKIKAKSSGIVAQGVECLPSQGQGPEFKPMCCLDALSNSVLPHSCTCCSIQFLTAVGFMTLCFFKASEGLKCVF
jgi:hypothetical protein